jgi:hypothetical protein
MKKQIIAAFISAAALTANAQTTGFGLKAGVNANTFYLKTEGTGSDSRFSLTKPGFHIGGLADISFSPSFSIQPQLLFAMKGGKIGQSGTDTEFDFYTIDLPINLLYRHNGFFIGGGPNFSYGVSAKGQATGNPEIDLYEDDALGAGSRFKRFEVGANVLMGYRFPGGFMLSSNWTPGLTDIFEEGTGSTGVGKANNSFFGFSIGYIFGAKNKAKK